MTKQVNKTELGERKVSVRELVESELDLIVGGADKKTQTKAADKEKDDKKTSADYLTVQLTNVIVTS